MSKAFEVGFDGLVGPTHNYSGLSYGNIASTAHKESSSNPLEAVLQGLDKALRLSELGLKQAILPPQERPDIATLKKLGFSGSEKEILRKVAEESPEVLAACASASSMWTANAATVTPSADSADGKVHFTPANLISKFHRSIEPPTTAAVLKKIFKDPKRFVHHDPLPPGTYWGDEGAANHTRLCDTHGKKGVQFFVFGRYAFRSGEPEPRLFPARQTFEASLAVARRHRLDPEAVVFAQQNPDAIDAGVFHNDVAAVGNQSVLFFHEQAYLRPREVLSELSRKMVKVTGTELRAIEVPASSVNLNDAVKSYLFNSQLVTLPGEKMVLVAPTECREISSVARYLKELLEDQTQPIRDVLYFDVKQSMRNGGGPACLRLRVVLTQREIECTNQKIFLDAKLHVRLVKWAKKHYRDRLSFDDLRDPSLLNECRRALDELTSILGLGSVYPFQKA